MSIYRGSHPAAKDVPVIKGAFIAPTAKMFPLKAGDILLTIPHSEMEEKMEFLLGLAFGEPDTVEGKPVIETLHEMAGFVRQIIVDFDKLRLLA